MNPGFYIGNWEVQPRNGQITQDGKTLRLEPKVMSVLEVLASRAGEAVTRAQILDYVWPNQEVSDDVLTSTVSSLRRALGDDRRENRFIETLPKIGYRVVAPVRPMEVAHSPVTEARQPTRTEIRSRLKIRRLSLYGIAIIATLLMVVWVASRSPDKTFTPDDRSIAVLPLDVFSSAPDIQHFASGLEEELIHQLARLPGFRVIARTSSFQFRDRDIGIRKISEILNVRHVIEGSVRDSEQGVRVTIQLIDATTDAHLWSEVFDISVDRLISMQEEVGMAVSRMIAENGASARQALQPPRHPVPDSAYRLFLLGEAHMRVGTAAAYRKASDYFADAIRIAPDYALAYSRIAATYMLLYQYGGEPLEQASRMARKALDTALQLDPGQPEALATMGLMFTYEKDFKQAELYFQKALEQQDNLRFALHNYGFMLWSESRFDEALVPLRKALELDPLSGNSHFLLGDSMAGTGALEQAAVQYQSCMDKLPEYYACPAGLASLELLQSDVAKAAETIRFAGTLIPEDNFWQMLAKANLALQQNDFESLSTWLEKATRLNPQNYTLLRLKLIHSLATGQLFEFEQELQQLLTDAPRDRDVRLIAALTYFYTGDCVSAVDIYEEELEQVSAFLVDTWDVAFGISHSAALGFCYQSMQQTESMAKAIDLLDSYHSDRSVPDFPGRQYLKSNYLKLIGEQESADALLAQLETSAWPLAWLAMHDPIQNHMDN